MDLFAPKRVFPTLHRGDCLDVLRALPDASVDSVVTDPPAGIAFMGKAWDEDKGGRRQWIAWLAEVMGEALRVLKPGGHALVWALPRTSHWTATALEDAGFEVRDCLVHVFGSGFPKSMDVSKAMDKAAGAEREVVGLSSRHGGGACVFENGGFATNGKPTITAPATDLAKQWTGWGTALKPASEHWWLVRKPLIGTVAANVERHGTGALNIDASRVESSDTLVRPPVQRNNNAVFGHGLGAGTQIEPLGRWPPNILFAHGETCDGDSCENGCPVLQLDLQNNGASRFFPVFRYQAKPSKSEKGATNVHPTVKSIALMDWLIRLVTPLGGVVLDPFLGSGTTGVAAVKGGFGFIGIEREDEYLAIARARIEAA